MIEAKTFNDIESSINNCEQQLLEAQTHINERFRKISTDKVEIERRFQQLNLQEKKLKNCKENWEKEKRIVKEMNMKVDDMVKLKVGGERFVTTRSTLCSMEGTMLAAMFSGRHHLHMDEQGFYNIERDPNLFRYILQCLRNSRFDLPKDKVLAEEISNEFDYFCLPIDDNKDHKIRYKRIKELKGHTHPVGCLGLLESGRLVSGSNDNTLKIWNLETGENEKTLTGHSGSVYALKVFKNQIISGSLDKRIQIWNTQSDGENGTPVANLIGHTDRVWCLKLSSDGKTLVSGSADNTIKIWDIATLQSTMTLRGHRSWVRCLEISENKIYSGSDDNEIRVWDMCSGDCITVIKGHDESVFALAVINDLVVSGAKDQTIRIWDKHTGELKETLFGHTRPVYCLQWVEGFIISGSWDSTIRIWDLKEFRCVQKLVGHTRAVYALIVAGDYLISGSSDNTVIVWKKEEEEVQEDG